MLVQSPSDVAPRDVPPQHNRIPPASGTPDGPRRSANVLLLLLLALALAASTKYWWRGAQESATSAPATRAEPVTREGSRIAVPEGSPVRSKLAIEPVAMRNIARDLVIPAVVEADPANLVKVLPPLAGRITQLKVQLGERLKAGQPLVVIDSPDLGTAYADYDRGKELLSLAAKNRDRARGLAKIGGAADKDLQQSEADYVTATVEFARAAAHLKQIGVDPNTANKAQTVTVLAPNAGSVIDLAVAPGAYWNDTTAALMTIADLRTIWVAASVPEKDSALVTKGQSADVTFTAYPGETFKGNVLFVSDVLDPDTRRTKVRIAFPNPDTRLKPGMFATVNFAAPSQSLPAVPTSALILKDDLTQVFVEVAPWTFEAHTVDIAFQQGEQAVIRSGVKAGERIVVKGGVLLGD
jgi:cobalt-zinc-cadmium efflux system membrane fusion protein